MEMLSMQRCFQESCAAATAEEPGVFKGLRDSAAWCFLSVPPRDSNKNRTSNPISFSLISLPEDLAPTADLPNCKNFVLFYDNLL